MNKMPETKKTSFWEFVEFKTMITPSMIVFIFWLGVVVCIFAGLWQMIDAQSEASWDQKKFETGIAILLLGPLALRIICESLILFFRMNETLTEIKNEHKSSTKKDIKVNT